MVRKSILLNCLDFPFNVFDNHVINTRTGLVCYSSGFTIYQDGVIRHCCVDVCQGNFSGFYSVSYKKAPTIVTAFFVFFKDQ